jgi:hypothetical protein
MAKVTVVTSTFSWEGEGSRSHDFEDEKSALNFISHTIKSRDSINEVIIYPDVMPELTDEDVKNLVLDYSGLSRSTGSHEGLQKFPRELYITGNKIEFRNRVFTFVERDKNALSSSKSSWLVFEVEGKNYHLSGKYTRHGDMWDMDSLKSVEKKELVSSVWS